MKLYQQCQDQLKKDPKNTEGKRPCDEGMEGKTQGGCPCISPSSPWRPLSRVS